MNAPDMPDTPVARAADDAMTVFRERVEEAGGTVEEVAIFAHVRDMNPSAISAGHGFENGGDLLAFLLAHADAVARRVGFHLDFMTVERPGQG
jgi:hypothetical protein